ncbi:competence type IV pilus minor pilin ComGD [Neobacillus ginsengisoli]|uniref:Competence protein ComGD n=1 Tax=Neobacillus ginsengisoli TaxID=904295 RepID=A0ABT9XP40_9BACI|nr:competence type IV pilus minor pilin ComGD [Neobacillus ginsengisoli]MDQ0197316.1 competence protein ComGD [Neobacillus ginsengisoli]
MKNKQDGFTLIESLLVLSVFLIISSITAFTLKPQYSTIDDEAFLSQLQADLLYAQQYAISHQHEVTVIFFSDQYKYNIYMRSDLPNIIERNYSTNMTVYGGSLPLYFKFLPDGNVNKFGSFYIKSSKKNYRLTVLIGKGRFYVVEE